MPIGITFRLLNGSLAREFQHLSGFVFFVGLAKHFLAAEVGQPLELFPASATQALSKVGRLQAAQEGLVLLDIFFISLVSLPDPSLKAQGL